jgi:hypothetical protein
MLAAQVGLTAEQPMVTTENSSTGQMERQKSGSVK